MLEYTRKITENHLIRWGVYKSRTVLVQLIPPFTYFTTDLTVKLYKKTKKKQTQTDGIQTKVLEYD